jgi:formylglycine-generating enzyme required for sulfatase activity
MHGNVCEWCQDAMESRRPRGPVPVIVGGEVNRVNRGGGWLDYAATCRSAARSGRPPSLRSSDQGFRVVLSVP